MDRRKFMKYGVGSIVGLGVIGAVLPDSDEDEDEDNSSNEQQAQATSKQEKSTPEKAKEDTQTPTSTPTNTPPQTEKAEKNTIITPDDKLKVLSAEMEDSMLGPKVTGVIKNVSGQELGYAQVKIAGFTENDVQVSEWIDNTTGFPAGGKWKYGVSMTVMDEETEIAYWKGETSTTVV